MKIFLVCTGTGRVNRGIEVFAQSAFLGLRDLPDIEIRLFKGVRSGDNSEEYLPHLGRDSFCARIIGRLTGRDGYAVEQWSSFLPFLRRIRQERPDVIFYGDANLGFLLYRFRSLTGVPYRLLYHNGGPCRPPFVRTDHVQQLTPAYYQAAIDAGEPADKHSLVPIGIAMPPPPSSVSSTAKSELQSELGLPPDRQLILSVGWIRSAHKRMDYLIREVSMLPRPRPFLLMLGQQDAKSREIINLAETLLGVENFQIKTVIQNETGKYYRAADVFVLASLLEAFGIVYLEALMHGLPVIAHRHPVMEYVLGDVGILGDLSQPGNLTVLLTEALKHPNTEALMQKRWSSVRDRFSWPVLAPAYQAMFAAVATQPLPKKVVL